MVKYDSCLAKIIDEFIITLLLKQLSTYCFILLFLINAMCVVSGRQVAARPSIWNKLYMSAHKTAAEAR